MTRQRIRKSRTHHPRDVLELDGVLGEWNQVLQPDEVVRGLGAEVSLVEADPVFVQVGLEPDRLAEARREVCHVVVDQKVDFHGGRVDGFEGHVCRIRSHCKCHSRNQELVRVGRLGASTIALRISFLFWRRINFRSNFSVNISPKVLER